MPIKHVCIAHDLSTADVRNYLARQKLLKFLGGTLFLEGEAFQGRSGLKSFEKNIIYGRKLGASRLFHLSKNSEFF